jgi:drug/metabolite transporter (DMT)-like permease
LSQVVYLLGTVGAVTLGVSAGTAALIAALQPVVAGALAGPVLGERVGRGQWVGLAGGLIGVALVVGADLGAGGSAPGAAYLLPFAGMAGLVAATLLERRAGLDIPVVDGLAVQCATSAVVFTVLGTAAGVVAPPPDSRFWAAVIWFVVLSTIGGYGSYWLVLRRVGVTRLSSLLYLTPPVTMLWAFAMFGDTVTTLALAGTAICLAAVLAVQRAGSRTQEAGLMHDLAHGRPT